jgi:hypothetical protein
MLLCVYNERFSSCQRSGDESVAAANDQPSVFIRRLLTVNVHQLMTIYLI